MPARQQNACLACLQDSQGKLTPLGSKMARLPVDPQYAAVLLAASTRGCLWEGMAIVSMASSERVLHVPKDRCASFRL